MPKAILVLCNCASQDEAQNIAHTLVNEKLAACVNIMPNHLSIYEWEGQVVEDPEVQLLIKTTPSTYSLLEKRIQLLHSYDVPEIIAIDIKQGLPAYLSWIEKSTL
jgi:periplasmic divalent cation tolerance protein